MTLGPTVAATQGTRTASAARGVAAPSGRSSERDVKGLWQSVSAVLFGVIVTGAGAWLTFGQDRIARNELREALAAQAVSHERQMEDLRGQVKDLVRAQHAMTVEVALLTQRLADIVARGK